MLDIEQITREPRTLAEINPKGLRQFKHRTCVTCRKPIMRHYVLNYRSQLATNWYCYRDSTQYSQGMANDQ